MILSYIPKFKGKKKGTEWNGKKCVVWDRLRYKQFLCAVSILVSLSVAGSDHMRDVFVKTMGLSDVDIVALFGGHNQFLFVNTLF